MWLVHLSHLFHGSQVTVNGLGTGAAEEHKEHYERLAPAQEEKAQEEGRSFLSLTDQPMAKDSIRGRTTRSNPKTEVGDAEMRGFED